MDLYIIFEATQEFVQKNEEFLANTEWKNIYNDESDYTEDYELEYDDI